MPSHSSNSKTARIAANGPLLRRALTVFCACLLVVSMMLSPFLLSVSMWGLVFAAFWESTIVCRRNGRAGDFRRAGDWFKTLAWSFKNLFRQPPLTLFLLLLLAPAMSFFWSADEAYWLERTRVRLPFLVLPWAFANLPRLAPRHFRLVLYVLVAALTVISLVVAVNVWLHLDDMIAGIGRGDPIPVPRSHIRFSLILATGIISGAWLWLEGFYWRWRQERWLLAAAVLFLFFFIHLLSVRSGIAGLYAILFFSAGWFVWRTKRWGLGLFVLIVALATPAIALRTIPSLRMRVQYMQWDWQQYRSNLGNTYSDAERMISLRTTVHALQRRSQTAAQPVRLHPGGHRFVGVVAESARIFFSAVRCCLPAFLPVRSVPTAGLHFIFSGIYDRNLHRCGVLPVLHPVVYENGGRRVEKGLQGFRVVQQPGLV